MRDRSLHSDTQAARKGRPSVDKALKKGGVGGTGRHARPAVMRDRGFALLEVIVAAALLIVLAAGVSRIVAAAIREGLAARLRAVATIAAADKSEELRSVPLTDLVSGADYLDAAGASIGTGPAPPRSAVYTRRWTVQAVGSDPEVFALCVKVFMRDGSLSARVTTLRAGR